LADLEKQKKDLADAQLELNKQYGALKASSSQRDLLLENLK